MEFRDNFYLESAKRAKFFCDTIIYANIRICSTCWKPRLFAFALSAANYRNQESPTDIYIVADYCSLGTLAEYMRDKPSGLNVTLVSWFVGQLGCAIRSLRHLHVMHRDLKPQNILLTVNLAHSLEEFDPNVGKCNSLLETDLVATLEAYRKRNITAANQALILRVADFGFARTYGDALDTMAQTVAGSPLYMAPEILACAIYHISNTLTYSRNEPYDERVDLWSFGVILFEMLTGRVPFTANHPLALLQVVRNATSPITFESSCGGASLDGLRHICQSLLKARPEDRIGFEPLFSADAMKTSMAAVRNYWCSLDTSYARFFDAATVPDRVLLPFEEIDASRRPVQERPLPEDDFIIVHKMSR
jgi:serine/threonine protein kinase